MKADYPPNKINGKWVCPWISDKNMFSAVNFSRKLLLSNDFRKSIAISANYYDIDRKKLAVIIRQIQENIRNASQIIEKKQVIEKVDLREPWEAVMDSLEAVMCD